MNIKLTRTTTGYTHYDHVTGVCHTIRRTPAKQWRIRCSRVSWYALTLTEARALIKRRLERKHTDHARLYAELKTTLEPTIEHVKLATLITLRVAGSLPLTDDEYKLTGAISRVKLVQLSEDRYQCTLYLNGVSLTNLSYADSLKYCRQWIAVRYLRLNGTIGSTLTRLIQEKIRTHTLTNNSLSDVPVKENTP